MSKTVTVRRGEKLPENMAAPWVETTILTPSRLELKPGDVLPSSSLDESITVEVHDDPPQAYLIVPCEPGKGSHMVSPVAAWLANGPGTTHQQIPCPLTLEDLRKLFNYTLGTLPTMIPPECVEAFKRLGDTIVAWAAVPQAKEDDNV